MSLTIIKFITPGSPAHRAGLRTGETLVAINGQRIVDVLDYKYYAYDPELELTLKEGEDQRTVFITKDVGEYLGLEFETYLMDRARSCANKCVFCFVDQLPKGMRESLYFKDDDARLSFLLGNYITLTNLSRRELQRICDLHISPINISVHATDPEVRKMLLGSRRGGEIMDIMKRFAEAGIVMNCQIVSCPGINDGEVLQKSMEDLAAMYPQVKSVSVVPVGLTRHREGLYPLEPYTREKAEAVVKQVEAYAQQCLDKTGSRIFWCSDEFYIQGGLPLPEDDNGVPYMGWASCAMLSCRVVSSQDLGSHTLFIAEVTDAKVLSDRTPVTYADYQDHIKPKPEKKKEDRPIVGWKCKICNYVYEGSTLPADYQCPLCGHGPEDFEPVYG